MIQIGHFLTTFCQEGGILLQKYRDRNGRCIAILFRSIGVRGQFDSPKRMNCIHNSHFEFEGDSPSKTLFLCLVNRAFSSHWVSLRVRIATNPQKPLTCVSEPVPWAHGKSGLERGWQKRLAEGWRRVGEGLAQGWRRVGEGVADFLAPSNF